MSPDFGPLSAERDDLKGLTKHRAMGKIRQEIRQAIRQIAPQIPEFQLPHDPKHKVTGPWLCVGTEGQLDAGRWYQACNFCDPVIHHFFNDCLDPNLLTGESLLGGLFRLYQEIKATPDLEGDVTCIKHPASHSSAAATRVVRK